MNETTTEIATTDLPPEFENMTLVATDPHAMAQAQAKLVTWCEQKVGFERRATVEATENAMLATDKGWPGEGKRWQKVANASRKRAEFYEKVGAAIGAGYYIVPPFPVDVFAIRTKKDPGSYLENKWDRTHRRTDHPRQDAQLLAVGEGENRNPLPLIAKDREVRTLSDGKSVTVQSSWATDWADMEFPFGLVRPEIIDATNRALALKVFDQMGILPNRRTCDPIIVGQILSPATYHSPITFFVAWWLRTEDIR